MKIRHKDAILGIYDKSKIMLCFCFKITISILGKTISYENHLVWLNFLRTADSNTYNLVENSIFSILRGQKKLVFCFSPVRLIEDFLDRLRLCFKSRIIPDRMKLFLDWLTLFWTGRTFFLTNWAYMLRLLIMLNR